MYYVLFYSKETTIIIRSQFMTFVGKMEKSLEITDYKKMLVIDRFKLEDELIKQPSLFFDIAVKCSNALSERDALKEEKDRVWAKEYLKNKGTVGPDGKYPTDATAKALTDASDEYEKAITSFFESKERADILYSLKEAFQERATMLRELCSLWTTGYYQDMSINKSDEKINEMKERMR